MQTAAWGWLHRPFRRCQNVESVVEDAKLGSSMGWERASPVQLPNPLRVVLRLGSAAKANSNHGRSSGCSPINPHPPPFRFVPWLRSSAFCGGRRRAVQAVQSWHRKHQRCSQEGSTAANSPVLAQTRGMGWAGGSRSGSRVSCPSTEMPSSCRGRNGW